MSSVIPGFSNFFKNLFDFFCSCNIITLNWRIIGHIFVPILLSQLVSVQVN